MMKIQLGEIAMNKTKRYLAPCLKSYGDEFGLKIHSIWKIAIGIGDIITVKSNISFEKHIFILVYPKNNIKIFNNFMNWIKDQPMYEEDYAFDHIKNGHLHMLVIKLPEDCYHSYETFKKGDYSKMYTPEELQEFFDQESDTFKILIKDHNYKLKFSSMLKKEYDIDLTPEEIDDKFEFEFPIKDVEEIFNTEFNGGE